MVKTLVDCDCVARVHGDGSGIELDFCPTHDAAYQMERAIRDLVSLCLEMRAYIPDEHPMLRRFVTAIGSDAVSRAMNSGSREGRDG